MLTDPRIDPTAGYNRAIRWASENGHEKTVKLLLAYERVDPSAEDNIAIIKASEKGHTDTVKLLFYNPRVNALQNIK